MVEFEVPINRKQRLAYIPKVLVKSFGYNLKITPNTKAAVMYSSATTLKDVLRSIRDLERHFEALVGEDAC